LLRSDCIEPNAENASEAELLLAMECAPNKRSYRRLAAIRALCKGYSRAQVGELFGRSERMVRLWILAFNRGGIDALASKPRPGRPRKAKLQRVRDLLVPVLEEPALAGQLHWTGVKLHAWLKEQLCVQLGYRTVIRYLHQLDYNLRVPQPWPERQNEQERAAFLKSLQELRADPRVEIWYGDECGIEGDPRPRRRWTARGSRPRVPYLGDHIRANVVGAVCPKSGENFSMIFDAMNTDCFQLFLDQLAETIPPEANKRRVLIVDNASWHKAQRLKWHHFEHRFLPTYSPDFNPIERLWLRLKADYFTNFIARTPEQLTQRLLHALKAFMDDPPTVASQCATRK
jgi:putative transposase